MCVFLFWGCYLFFWGEGMGMSRWGKFISLLLTYITNSISEPLDRIPFHCQELRCNVKARQKQKQQSWTSSLLAESMPHNVRVCSAKCEGYAVLSVRVCDAESRRWWFVVGIPHSRSSSAPAKSPIEKSAGYRLRIHRAGGHTRGDIIMRRAAGQ